MAQTLLVATVLVAGLGCSLHRANHAFAEGRYEDATREYQSILRKDPGNVQARNGYRRAAPLAATEHVEKAKVLESRGQLEETATELKRALVLDSNNGIALDWLARIQLDEQRRKAKESAEDYSTAKAKAQATAPMQLNPRSIEGISLTFSKKTSLKEIFAILSKASGVNIIPHSSFQDMQVQIDMQGLSFQQALDTLMLQNDLFYKKLDTQTIMIFKSNPQNRELYENHLIRTFYLSNAEVDGVRQILQTLIPQLKIFTDKRLNAVTIKAKPNELVIAEHIVNQLDKAKPEVMVYMELLEVTESSAEQIGLLPVIQPTDGMGGGAGVFRLGATIDNTGGLNQNKGALRISKSDLRFLFPSIALDVLKSNGDAKLVASPNVRVLSGETGEVNIGEKISTTQSALSLPSSTTGQSGGLGGLGGMLGGGASTQFSYEDVGVKIKVEPRVHHNGDITMKIDADITTLKAGSTAGRPDLGKRSIKTMARLRDGETAVFGGLLKEEEQKSLQGIWGITDIPVLGKLLGNTKKNKAKTDVLLTIRTVLVRKPSYSQEDLESFDPDLATSKAGPFSQNPESVSEDMKQAKAPDTMKPAAAAATTAAPTAQPKPTPAGAVTPPPAVVPAPIAAPSKGDEKADAKPDAKPEIAPDTKAAEPKGSEDNADLVFFMSPYSEALAKGEKLQITLNASSAKGLTSGTFNLLIDPKLKLLSVSPGDFITADGGSLEQKPGKDGAVAVTFKKAGASVDSGALLMLQVQALAPGNAPVLIQSGTFMVGKNPIPGRWVNALVTVN
jgi:general secretion pathway protein D